MKVTIVGLGAQPGDISLRGLRALQSADCVFLRTERTELTQTLIENGIAYRALDELYERCADYDELSRAIAGAVLDAGMENIAYAAPGGAAVGDSTVTALFAACAQRGVRCEILPGAGWHDAAAAAIGGVEQTFLASAADYADMVPDPRTWLLVAEVDRRELAGELKLKLLDAYPPEHRVFFCGAEIALYELDRQRGYGHDAALAVPPLELLDAERYDFGHLVEIVDVLRDPAAGCPWDREQTHASLKQFMIEEAYEALDAIDSADPWRLADELGDVLLQVVLHAHIASEHGEFSIGDVTSAICGKMISRHTHIFGADRADTAEAVLMNWEANKKKEKGLASQADALRDVPRTLPAAMRAQKLLRKAAAAGAGRELSAALDELCAYARGISRESSIAQCGDLLLLAMDIARLVNIPAELALDAACERFVEWFGNVEDEARRAGRPMEEMSKRLWGGIADAAKPK